jgi:hypothetical protein
MNHLCRCLHPEQRTSKREHSILCLADSLHGDQSHSIRFLNRTLREAPVRADPLPRHTSGEQEMRVDKAQSTLLDSSVPR